MKKYLQMPFSTREYMLSKDFELFYYNDKHITPLKEHSHKYYEFYFFLGGDVSITIKKQKEISPQNSYMHPFLLVQNAKK